MRQAGQPWTLVGFEPKLDLWIELESPDVELRALVIGWVLSRIEDPYSGMRREPGFANLWFGAIPGTGRPDRTVVVCSVWIEEQARLVRCDLVATLHPPA